MLCCLRRSQRRRLNVKENVMAFRERNIEMSLAIASFCVAVILAFVSMALHDEHDIAAGVCMVIAQFLILTASIIGIDYKLNNYGSANYVQKNK